MWLLWLPRCEFWALPPGRIVDAHHARSRGRGRRVTESLRALVDVLVLSTSWPEVMRRCSLPEKPQRTVGTMVFLRSKLPRPTFHQCTPTCYCETTTLSTHNHVWFPRLFVGITCGLSAPFVASQLEFCRKQPERFCTVLLGFNPPELARTVPIEGWDRTFADVVAALSQGERCHMLLPIVGPEVGLELQLCLVCQSSQP